MAEGRALRALMLGAGQRGLHDYGGYARAHRERFDFVAVADPIADRRERAAREHGIDPAAVHEDWRTLVAARPAADVCCVLLPDSEHAEAALAALAAGYHVFLEKPMATTLPETRAIARAAARHQRLIHVAHVLRYTPFFRRLKEVVDSGVLGEIIAVAHRENVSSLHMAHSFVRGNWRRAGDSCPMILAKCCHDFDLLHWIVPGEVLRLSSFGSLQHFRPDKAPAEALSRCSDGCAVRACPFDARAIYLDESATGWPITVVTEDLSTEGRHRAIVEGPYGRCVYHCDNDVVDHQVVQMELDTGTTVTLTIHGHSHHEARTMRYDGSLATIRGYFSGDQQSLEIHHHAGGRVERLDIDGSDAGHGGGDAGVLEALWRAVCLDEGSSTSAQEALESHTLAFAAEEARLSGRVIDMSEYRERGDAERAL